MTKSGLNLNCLFRVIVFCVPDAWLFCVVVNSVIRVGLGLLYISVVVLQNAGGVVVVVVVEMNII